MAGRRTKYTPETVDKITQAIRLGATYQLACNFAGISMSTFHLWQGAKPEFLEAITQAAAVQTARAARRNVGQGRDLKPRPFTLRTPGQAQRAFSLHRSRRCNAPPGHYTDESEPR